MAAGDLASKDDVKGFVEELAGVLKYDSLLDRLVSTFSVLFKSETGRAITKASFTDSAIGTGRARMELNEYPVVSVTSVKVGGEVVPASVGGEPGWLLRDDGLDLVGLVFGRGSAVEVQYVAGYDPIPADITQAVVSRAALAYRERGTIGQSMVANAGESVMFNTNVSGALGVWNTVVNAYRRPGVG